MHRNSGDAYRRSAGEVRPGHDTTAGGHVPREVDGRWWGQAQRLLDARLQVGEAAELGVRGWLVCRAAVREGGAELGGEFVVDRGVGQDVVEGVA
jgi:hypothetical protein